MALAVMLLMTPAALHRIVWAGEDSENLLTTGGALTILALLPLALGMAGDAYVVLARERRCYRRRLRAAGPARDVGTAGRLLTAGGGGGRVMFRSCSERIRV